jgi:hypothetical protein
MLLPVKNVIRTLTPTEQADTAVWLKTRIREAVGSNLCLDT